MLELNNIKKVYKDGTVGIKNVNITLPDKGLVLIVGKSGSGKSTLINMISGMSKPTDGRIIYNGKDIKKVGNYKSIIGYVFQDFNLIKDLNVIDNINLIDNKKTDELINLLGINNLKNKKINEISGGEARRVGIARSLNKNALILLCDEPTESLDETNEKEILAALKKISKDILVIVVSHKDAIKSYADRIISVSKGEIVDDKVINEDKKRIDTTLNKSKVSVFKLIKIGFFRIIHNFGLFSLNLSSLFLVMSLLLIALVIKSTDLDKIEIDEMIRNNNYKMNLTGSSIVNEENKLKGITDKYNRVYEYILRDGLLDFKLDRSNGEKIGAFYISSINRPLVVHINESTFIKSDKIVGNIPEFANEVLISEYTFEGFKKFGVKTETGEYKKYNTLDEVFGEKLVLGDKTVIISGVLRQNIDEFAGFKDIDFPETHNQKNYFSMFEHSIVDMNYLYVLDDFDEYIQARYDNLEGFYLNTDDESILYEVKSNFKDESLMAIGRYTEILSNYQNLINKLKVFGRIALVILFVFASVLLFNYFSNSIENHEKDNRILKYLGVSNFGLFIPYLFSLLLLMFISVLGSVVVFDVFAKTLNGFYYNILSNRIDIFVLSSSSIFPLICAFFIVILILSLISIYKINKTIKKYTE